MPPRGNLFAYNSKGKHYRVDTRLTKEEMAMVERLARKEDVPMAEAIRQAIHDADEAMAQVTMDDETAHTIAVELVTLMREDPDFQAMRYPMNGRVLFWLAQELGNDTRTGP